MAEGWLLVVGLGAFAGVLAIAAVALRRRSGAPEAQDGLLALGPAIIALGILFGEDPLIGSALIAGGTGVSIVAAMLGRSAPTR